MTTEFDLSKKRREGYHQWHYFEEDAKEFIRRLKENLNDSPHRRIRSLVKKEWIDMINKNLVFEEIDKLVGKQLSK